MKSIIDALILKGMTQEEAEDTAKEILEEAMKMLAGNGCYDDMGEMLLDYDLDADYEMALLMHMSATVI